MIIVMPPTKIKSMAQAPLLWAEEPQKTMPIAPDNGQPFSSFRFAKDNPDCLLGNDWVEKGSGVIEVSSAGQGKSVMALQQAATWALGRDFFGIKPARPLKSLVIQSEDSPRFIARCWAGIKAGLGLSDSQVETLTPVVIVRSLRGLRGPTFITELTRLVGVHAPDLVWINPMYAYAAGNISDGEDAAEFLSSLDRVNRERKFAYFLIHHTTKPKAFDPKEKKKESSEAMYSMHGSAFFTNWPRATILIQPVRGYEGEFVMSLDKNGKLAGAKQNGKLTTKIGIRHSFQKCFAQSGTPGEPDIEIPRLFWEPSEMPSVEDLPSNKPSAQEYSDDALVALFPSKENAGCLGIIQKDAEKKLQIKSSQFFLRVRNLREKGRVIKTRAGKYHKANDTVFDELEIDIPPIVVSQSIEVH